MKRLKKLEESKTWGITRRQKTNWWRCSISVCVRSCVRERKKGGGVSTLQQSVGSAFTVAEQSGRHSQPAGSTWHAISSAPGTLAAQPAKPKHTSFGDQNNTKQTHTKHTDKKRCGGRGVGREGIWQRHSAATVGWVWALASAVKGSMSSFTEHDFCFECLETELPNLTILLYLCT